MDKRIVFQALSARKGIIEPVLAGTVTGRLCSSGPEIQELPKVMDTRRLKVDRDLKVSVIGDTTGPRPEWVRTRWPDSPADLGTFIHEQMSRFARERDHELMKSILFGNWDTEVNQVHDSLILGANDWDAMKEYCEMDIEATEQALKATNKIMAAMEDTLDLDGLDDYVYLPEPVEPELDGDDLMAAVRSFCRQ